MKLNYDNTSEQREIHIKCLNKTIEEYNERLCKVASDCNVSDHDSLSKDYEEKLRAKDKELASQKEMIKSYIVSHNRIKKLNKEDTFSMKPKGRGSTKNIFNKCDNTSGDSVNVDLIS